MKKKIDIKDFQSLSNVTVICKTKLKHLKGGEMAKGSKGSSKID